MSINPSSARRRLFVESNDENDDDAMVMSMNTESNQNFANNFIEELKRQRNEMTQKYNFDFENEIPLEGNYVWERIEPIQISTASRSQVNLAADETERDGDDEEPAAVVEENQSTVESTPQKKVNEQNHQQQEKSD